MASAKKRRSKVSIALIGGKEFPVRDPATIATAATPAKQRGLQDTASNKIVEVAAKSAKDLVAVIEDLQGAFQGQWQGWVASPSAPHEMTIEFSLGLEAEISAWVISGKGNADVKVSFTWKKDGHA